MKNYDVGHVPLRLPRAKQLLGVIDRYAQQSANLPPKYPNTTQIPSKHLTNHPHTETSALWRFAADFLTASARLNTSWH